MKSWNTAATRERHDERSSSRMSTPSISMAPDCGSYNRHSSLAIVVLPAPFCPTMASDEPAGIGIREDVTPITRNSSHFVPHYFT